MSIDEFIMKTEQTVINSEIVKNIEEKYDTILDDFVSKLVSVDKGSIFVENNVRRLSLYEILNSDDEYGTKFTSEHIIPLFDLSDNDFLGYDYLEKDWKIYNIIDKSIFDTKPQLKDYFI